jgi:hypothetical protein
LGVVLLGCWLFSVKAYLVDDRSIIVRHPFWSARFELRGLTPEDQLPSSDAIRLFASNWIFCHSLGVCYSKASGRFISYLTNPEYKLAVDTERGVLVISPRDKAALVRALPEGTGTLSFGHRQGDRMKNEREENRGHVMSPLRSS